MLREQLIEESETALQNSTIALDRMTSYLKCKSKIDEHTGDEFITRSVVADLLGITPAQVNTLQNAHKNPLIFTVTGKRNYRIHRDVFINWLFKTGRKIQ